MPEELQNLLDRIQEDGVAKADAKAAEIVSAAEKKADGITKDAEDKAAETKSEKSWAICSRIGENFLLFE